MSLWNPKKPLNQPPGYSRLNSGPTSANPDGQLEKAAQQALSNSQFARAEHIRREGVRHTVQLA